MVDLGKNMLTLEGFAAEEAESRGNHPSSVCISGFKIRENQHVDTKWELGLENVFLM